MDLHRHGRAGLVTEVRGLGSMVGVEFSERRLLAELPAASLCRGLLTVKVGKEARVLRHLMPLVIADEELDEAFAVFEDVASGVH